MLTKRTVQVVLFSTLLAAVALGPPHDARAYNWSTVTVDAAGEYAWTSIAVDAEGNAMMSYGGDMGDLKFAVCDLSRSTNSNCDQQRDWNTVAVEAGGRYTSIALDANGDPMISHYGGDYDLLFAICDRSGSTNGECDEADDWRTATVDGPGVVGYGSSIAVDANGNPMISYHDYTNSQLKFAVCDRSASTNGSCGQQGDWSTVALTESQGSTSIAVDANGDPMISHHIGHVGFAMCDRSASTNGNCDQASDWRTVTVGTGGLYTSIAVDANGDPMISSREGPLYDEESLEFAMCVRSASSNGNCDQPDDWTTVTVDSAGAGNTYTSIAVDVNGDPVISYYDVTNQDLKFATCDLPATSCDETVDWSTETVESAGDVGSFTSIAVGTSGHPVISYADATNRDLRFATASPPLRPVGGIAELPQASDSSGPGRFAPAALAAAALVALTASAWLASRRRLR